MIQYAFMPFYTNSTQVSQDQLYAWALTGYSTIYLKLNIECSPGKTELVVKKTQT